MKLAKRGRFVVSGLVLFNLWYAGCPAFGEMDLTKVAKDTTMGDSAGKTAWSAFLSFKVSTGIDPSLASQGPPDKTVADGLGGLFNPRGSLLEIKNGTVKIDIPVIIPDIRQRGARGTDIVIAADLISGEF